MRQNNVIQTVNQRPAVEILDASNPQAGKCVGSGHDFGKSAAQR
jgi:hypothetical protein